MGPDPEGKDDVLLVWVISGLQRGKNGENGDGIFKLLRSPGIDYPGPVRQFGPSLRRFF